MKRLFEWIRRTIKKIRMNRLALIAQANSHTAVPPSFEIEPSIFSMSSPAEGTTSAAPTFPVSIEAGMDMLIFASHKTQLARAETPSGWRRPEHMVPFHGSNGGDQGAVGGTIFHKTAVGGESGTVTIDSPGGNSLMATIIVIAKDPSANLLYAMSPGHHNVINDPNYSARSYNKMNVKAGDYILCLSAVNTNLRLWSNQSLSMTGATFETTTQELYEISTAQGNNQEQIGSWFKCTSGNVTDFLTYAMEANGSSSSPQNPMGVTFFIRVRQSTETMVWWPSGYRIDRASEFLPVGEPADGGNMCNGDRPNFQGPDAASTRYILTEKDGRVCLKAVCDLTTGLNMRSEKTKVWQAAYMQGARIFKSIRYETDAWPNNPRTAAILAGANPDDNANPSTEFDIVQIHAGTAAGGPWPENAPQVYFGFSQPGQNGYDNLGGGATPAPGNNFIVVNKTAGTRHIYTDPDLEWGQNKILRIVYMIDFHVSTGALKVGVATDENAIVWVHEQYGIKTVWEAADIATFGSPADVGGVPKELLYHHSITSGNLAATVAAGHKGLVIYDVVEKSIIQYPYDPDYISDVTDNDDPIYNWLNTANE